MNDCWQNIIVGMKVEVENRDTDHSGVFSNSFWVAYRKKVNNPVKVDLDL